MQAEIISIGDEILIGMTIDSNAAWIGNSLTHLGINVYQNISISDTKEHILKAVDEAFSRSELVIVTGGLGPTSDDITKQTLCDYFDTSLVKNKSVYENIENFLAARGLEMNDNNVRQADVPEDCKVLPNALGTAPGMWFEKEGKVLISMPGVPYEMKYIMQEHTLPLISNFFNRPAIKYRLVMTFGTFEAKLAEILEDFEKELPENVSLAYLPTSGIIKLRLTGRGDDEDLVDRILQEQVDKLYGIIPDLIYGLDGVSLQGVLGSILKEKNLTLGIAESCTGGSLSSMITEIPGSSDYFKGSVIAYDNDIKMELLGVKGEDLEKHGAVSREVALQMARGVRKKLETDYGLSTTGIAGPGGGTEDKPVGTVWIAVSSKEGDFAVKHNYAFKRMNNIRRASLAAMNLLRQKLV